MQTKWDYKGYYKLYDMEGIIHMPYNSKLEVCDLINGIPDFMMEADILFIDPPCSIGNLTTFYTKADMDNGNNYEVFFKALESAIKKIAPEHIFIECFKSNFEKVKSMLSDIYANIIIYNNYYYNNKNNKCWIIHASENDIKRNEEMNNIDEEKFIKYICDNYDYECIGDLCMGLGLVGKYAYLNKKKFVGIELNKKRLANLIHFISNN